MTAPAAAVSVSRASARTGRFRTDIQALRAVAIGLVVLNHLWPDRVTGGYVGVDVFFVISGFLITGHLMSEFERSGRVRLSAFYARRIRRLLPAAIVVILVTLVGVWVLLPFTRWTDNAVQGLASVFYVENWTLAALSVNYSAHNAAASAVQHYWSLSVEEQFYLIWPLLILGAAAAAARWGRGADRRRALLVIVSLVAGASFVCAVVYTAASPAQAYFVTFTRAWQFAAGAAIALIPVALLGRLNAIAASLLSVAGFAGIAAAALFFGPHTPYPGVAALVPVLATVAVITAGTGRRAPLWAVSTFTDARPVQWVGEVSYSLYLWHWPLIVFAPFVLGAPLTWWSRISILALALALAWGSRRWIEIPAQRAAWWRPVPRAYLGAGALMTVAALAAALLLGAAAARSAAVEQGTLAGPCHGAAALIEVDCDPSGEVDDPVVTEQDAYFGLAPECGELTARLVVDGRQTTRECDFSRGDHAPRGGESPRVWLVGDSHAEQWQAALFPIAREQGWHLTISSFPGCPPADVAFTGFDAAWGPGDYLRCRDWSAALTDRLVDEKPDLVLTSMAARQQLVDDGTDRSHDDQFVAGLRRTWERWTAAGVPVIAIADTPLNGDVRDLDCLLLNPSEPEKCAVARSKALPPDPIGLAARHPMPGLWLADLNSFLCDDTRCLAAIGGVPVYYDADHLSSDYAATLSGPLRDVVDRALSGASAP